MGNRTILVAALLLAAGGPLDLAAARTWVSRDGQFTVEAELLNVESGQAVLRRSDGTLIRVPMTKLSLGDVKYVQEAMQAAGQVPEAPSPAGTADSSPFQNLPPEAANPPEHAADRPEAAASQPSAPQPQPPAPQPQPPAPQPQPPPTGKEDWQVVADPPAGGFAFPPNHSLNLHITSDWSPNPVLFPTSPSPYALAGGRSAKSRRLWDLRRGEEAGSIPTTSAYSQAEALSPDGAHFAFHSHDPQTGDAVEVHAFATGARLHRIPVQKFSRLRFLDFAGPDRLIAADSQSKSFRIWDVRTGRELGKTAVEPPSLPGGVATSPGGKYLAVCLEPGDCLQLYDLSSRQLAGTISLTPSQRYAHCRAKALGFSPDGAELGGWFDIGQEHLLGCWEMATGKPTAEHHFSADAVRELGQARPGPYLQWLPDRKGWLLGGNAIIDRAKGRVVWTDADAQSFNQQGTRRVVDGGRMLEVVATSGQPALLRLVPLPSYDNVAIDEVAAVGGSAADLGLPPLTLPDRSGVESVDAVTADGWNYQPDAGKLPAAAAARERIRFDSPHFTIGTVRFSRPEVARAAIGQKFKPVPQHWPKSADTVAHTYTVYNLVTGGSVAKFELPFPAELIDLGPEGQRAVFRRSGGIDRIDIWDLADGRHVAGMRPYHDRAPRSGRTVSWAALVDETHLLTLSDASEMVCWELPACRALYSLSLDNQRESCLSANRRAFAVRVGRQLQLRDARTGKTLGTLDPPRIDESPLFQHPQFRCDGRKLAAQLWHEDHCSIAVWDLTDGKLTSRVDLPSHSLGLGWCGAEHLLAHRVAPDLSRYSSPEIAASLVDVRLGIVSWNYSLPYGHHVWETPDDRHWFVAAGGLSGPAELVAVELPDADAQASLARTELPQPVLDRGARVEVVVVAENVPQTSQARWHELTALDDVLTEHFTKRFKKEGITVAGQAESQLLIRLEETHEEQNVLFRRGIVGPGQLMVLSKPLVRARIAVLDAQKRPVWELEKVIDQVETSLRDKPDDMDATTLLRLERWIEAMRWIRSATIPLPLMPPEARHGLGESALTPEGARALRSPPPRKPATQTTAAELRESAPPPG